MATLDGKIAIVTGAGQGLGRSHALALAAEGALVVVNDPAGSGAERPAAKVVQEILDAGGEAVANLESCADWDAAQALVDQAVETYGGLDIVVNNAGITRDGMSFNLEPDDWDAVITVNLRGHYAPARAAARYWRAKSKAGDAVDGRIVNTTSESGLYGNVGQANYAASKGAVMALTLVMARELERIGVTVNAIAPRARTPMTLAAMPNYKQPEPGAFDDRDPAHISRLVAWLAGPDAHDVSGHVFVVYGDRIQLVQGWTPIEAIDNGQRDWTLEGITAAKERLFASYGPGVPPNHYVLSVQQA